MELFWKKDGAYFTIEHVTTDLMDRRLNVVVPIHRHPVYHILYILDGRGKVTIGESTTEASPGMLYIIDPDEPHGFLFGDGVPLTNLECTFRLLDDRGRPASIGFFDIFKPIGGPAGRSPVREPSGARPLTVPERIGPLLKEGFERLLDANRDPMAHALRPAALADLVARVGVAATEAARGAADRERTDGTVASVKRFLAANLARPLTLRETADFAHVSPNYLCRLFKERTGESPMGYLQAARMREAEKLLVYTDLPVYAIAERVGYEEPSYFSRVFRRATGEPPQLYRKRRLSEPMDKIVRKPG